MVLLEWFWTGPPLPDYFGTPPPDYQYQEIFRIPPFILSPPINKHLRVEVFNETWYLSGMIRLCTFQGEALFLGPALR